MKNSRRNKFFGGAALILAMSLLVSTSPAYAEDMFSNSGKVDSTLAEAEMLMDVSDSALVDMDDWWNQEIIDLTGLEINVVRKKVTLEPAVCNEPDDYSPILLSDKDYNALIHIVQAEAGDEDLEGKILVANVVMNRVASDKFPDNVYDVVTQYSYKDGDIVYQFAPTAPGGSFWSCEPNDEVLEAVSMVLNGYDISEGAMYFVAKKYTTAEKFAWFSQNLTYITTHGNHYFFA